MHEKQLRAIHAQACTAVALVDRTITPADDRFWPLYLSAAFAAVEPEASETGTTMTDAKLDEHITAVQNSLGIYWFIPDDSERYLWRTINTDQQRRFAHALVTRVLAQHIGSDAARDVLGERRRQIDVKGFSADRDDMYDPGFLVSAAAAYLLYAADALNPFSQGDGGFSEEPPAIWSFGRTWWKPVCPRSAMKKAAALVIAEMERLDRDPGDESIHHHTRRGDQA